MTIRLTPVSLLLAALLGTGPLAGCGRPPEPNLSLYRAVQLADLEQIKRHLYWGTDLNARDPNGELPIHVAARGGQVVIVRELTRHGADPNALDAAGLTPLRLALVNGRTQAAAALIEGRARLDPQAELLALVRAGVSDRDSIDFLIRRGADLNRADAQGETALHLAVSLGHLETVKRLVSRGADLNRPNGQGATPLTLAQGLDPKSPNRAAIVRALTQYGAGTDPGAASKP